MSTPGVVYGLTRMQRDALLVIQELAEIDGALPSCSTIAQELGLRTRGGAYWLIEKLIERGYLARREGRLAIVRPIPFPEEPAIELTETAALLMAEL